jgi:hypothetical protein
LEALRRTYGYVPVAFTSSGEDRELEDGLVFCRIESWLTGRRLVSLPFSDHCQPLLAHAEDLQRFMPTLEQQSHSKHMKYIELRPAEAFVGVGCGLTGMATYWRHKLDMSASLDNIFRRFHKDCVQRKIRRAGREALTYERGTSPQLLECFYRLHVCTRKRLRIPPQPLSWFCNLVDCFREALTIRVAAKDGHPAASMITLRYRDVLLYKYGAADLCFRRCGAMQFLFWRTIQEAKHEGIQEFDLGRTDADASGLVTFKDRWGASRSLMTYWRRPASAAREALGNSVRVAGSLLRYLPGGLLAAAGRLLYKHAG